MYMYIRVCVYMCEHASVGMYVICLCVYTCVCECCYVYAHVSICMCACICVWNSCTWTHLDTYIIVETHTRGLVYTDVFPCSVN